MASSTLEDKKIARVFFSKSKSAKVGRNIPLAPFAGTGTNLEGLCLTVRRSDCKDIDLEIVMICAI